MILEGRPNPEHASAYATYYFNLSDRQTNLMDSLVQNGLTTAAFIRSIPEDKADFRPFRGNVFKTQERDIDGILINDTIKYDADSNIISIPGMVRWRDVSTAFPDDNLDERRNYTYADNINYLDGDVKSQAATLVGGSWSDPYDPSSGKPESSGMYEYANTSMINDEARVYKGGSWKDRAYWMVPGTRRFLDQRQATAWIGFRCAMTRVGSPVGLGK